MAKLENERHEGFAQAVAAGMTATDAYMHAYPTVKTRGSAKSSGYRLLTDATENGIADRIHELQAKTAEKLEITREGIAAEYADLISKAVALADVGETFAKRIDALDRAASLIAQKAAFVGILPAQQIEGVNQVQEYTNGKARPAAGGSNSGMAGALSLINGGKRTPTVTRTQPED